MTQPAKRIPTWLTIDVLVIIISLAIIGIGIGIGLLPSHARREPRLRRDESLPAKRSAVPELTQIADIKLNTQVSLWPTHAAIRLRCV